MVSAGAEFWGRETSFAESTGLFWLDAKSLLQVTWLAPAALLSTDRRLPGELCSPDKRGSFERPIG
jgi:hypothetical protein